MKWLHRATWALCVLSFAGTAALLDYTLSPRPEEVTPRELYSVVQRHLTACRAADFPQAYHAAASKVQEQYTLVQFEQKLRQDYQPVAAANHVEYGAVHHPRNDAKRALVDVYFISERGEAIGWTYSLVYEDGDWKVDHGEAIPGWPAGQRLKGLRV
jgi:hypothetical protein